MGFILSAFADEASRDFSEQLTALREEGIHKIELRGVDGKSCADLTDDEARLARQKMDDNGITLSALGSPYGKYPITEPFAAHFDAFRRGMDICHILGAERVRMFSFFMPKEEDPSFYRDEVMDRLNCMTLYAREAGVEPAHENEKAIFGDNISRSLDIARTFKGRMGLIFDPANFIQCGVDPAEAFPLLRDYLVYFHVKDAYKADGSVVPAGKGDGSVKEILSSLAPQGDMILTIEPHLTIFEGLNNLQTEEVRHAYTYPTPRAAFAAAVASLKDILTDIGYTERSGIWKK